MTVTGAGNVSNGAVTPVDARESVQDGLGGFADREPGLTVPGPSVGVDDPFSEPAPASNPDPGTVTTVPGLDGTVCACACGCVNLTGLPGTRSVVLARHARCSQCKAPGHAARYATETTVSDLDAGDVTMVDQGSSLDRNADAYEPNSNGNSSAGVSRPITELVPVDPVDAALDAAILAQQQTDIEVAARERWRALLPEKFRDATTDHPAVAERIRRWKQGHPGLASLVALGPVGEGKTWLAVSYANAALDEHLLTPGEILYGTEAELLASAANSSFGEVERLFRQLTSRRYRMIIIDDVGRGTWLRDDMRPKVFSLVLDAAYRDNRVIVLTTNLTPKELGEYIGEGAIDRLRALTNREAVTLTNRQMRQTVTHQTAAQLLL